MVFLEFCHPFDYCPYFGNGMIRLDLLYPYFTRNIIEDFIILLFLMVLNCFVLALYPLYTRFILALNPL